MRILNRICYCEKHVDQQLWVGGTNGKYLFCPRCRTDPERGLVSQLPRVLGTRSLLTVLAERIRRDSAILARVADTFRIQSEGFQRPDPVAVEQGREAVRQLTTRIRRAMDAPCETEEDEAEIRSTTQCSASGVQ